MRLALLINRSAGSFRHLVLESTVSAVMRALKAGGHSVELVICGRRNLPVRAAELAARDDLDGVVVGGGDGTILTAIRAGLGRGIVLGLLPLGTLNLLARDLGLPADPVEAARHLAAGSVQEIDLAEVNGQLFAIWASLGMHPWMVRRRDHLQRDGVRKWRAMALAALRVLRRYPMIEVTLTLDSDTVTVRTPFIVVTNNAWKGGLPPQRPALNEGMLEVHVARCATRRSLLWLAVNAALGRWRIERLLRTYQAKTVEVSGHNKHRIMLSLDGEVTVMRPPLCFREHPKALRVLMP